MIRVTAPEGCILNAKHPAPVAGRHVTGQMLPDVVFGCLHQALGGGVPAEGTSCLWNLMAVGGYDYWALVFRPVISWLCVVLGARPTGL